MSLWAVHKSLLPKIYWDSFQQDEQCLKQGSEMLNQIKEKMEVARVE